MEPLQLENEERLINLPSIKFLLHVSLLAIQPSSRWRLSVNIAHRLDRLVEFAGRAARSFFAAKAQTAGGVNRFFRSRD